MSEREELRNLIQRFEQNEPLTVEDQERMLVLACRLGINGLMNPEDDPWDGAKEDWFASAQNATSPDWEA